METVARSLSCRLINSSADFCGMYFRIDSCGFDITAFWPTAQKHKRSLGAVSNLALHNLRPKKPRKLLLIGYSN
jgi:hypothetical protein